MPRSDKLYVFIVVAFASVLVVGSIVATILTLTGDSDKRPGYESAPARELVRPNPTSGSIIDIGNAERPPIDDQTYLLLHRETRRMARALATGDGYAALGRRAGMPGDALAALIDERRQLNGVLQGLDPSKKTPVIVNRPSPSADRNADAELVASTSSSVAFKSRSISGDGGTMSLDINWSFLDNTWFMDEVRLDWSVSPGGTLTPTNPGESGETSDLKEQPEQDPTEGLPSIEEKGSDTPTSNTE